jgi:hypothetical protein
MTVKTAIRDLIDNLRMAIPGGRQFLDMFKDFSIYDVDDPNLPIIDKTIISKVIKAKQVKKIIVKDTERNDTKKLGKKPRGRPRKIMPY